MEAENARKATYESSKIRNKRKRPKQRRVPSDWTALRGQLRNDLDHLIDIDKLHPGLQILGIVMPDELGLFSPSEEGTSALVRFFNNGPVALDA